MFLFQENKKYIQLLTAILFSGININICKRIYKQVYKPLHMPSGRDYRYKSVVLHIIVFIYYFNIEIFLLLHQFFKSLYSCDFLAFSNVKDLHIVSRSLVSLT